MLLITLPCVTLAVLAGVFARSRHPKDWLLALSLLAYSPAIGAHGASSVRWPEYATPIILVALLVHCAAALWLAKSRWLVAGTVPLAIWLAVIAVVRTEMSANQVWF
jgi:hypothetical protein